MLRRVAANVEVCAIAFQRPMHCTSLAILTTSTLQRVVEAAGQWVHQQLTDSRPDSRTDEISPLQLETPVTT